MLVDGVVAVLYAAAAAVFLGNVVLLARSLVSGTTVSVVPLVGSLFSACALLLDSTVGRGWGVSLGVVLFLGDPGGLPCAVLSLLVRFVASLRR